MSRTVKIATNTVSLKRTGQNHLGATYTTPDGRFTIEPDRQGWGSGSMSWKIVDTTGRYWAQDGARWVDTLTTARRIIARLLDKEER